MKEKFNFKNRDEAMKAYIDKFGGYPMQLRGIADDILINVVKEALENNSEIYFEYDDNGDYIGFRVNNKSSDEFVSEYQRTLDTDIEVITDETQVRESNILKKNLDELLSFSILNKTIDELIVAKKKFIDDWLFYLKNVSDDYWAYDCGIYRATIKSIIDSIIRRIKDETSLKQLEYVNNIIEYIKNNDLVMVIKFVENIKQLEFE